MSTSLKTPPAGETQDRTRRGATAMAGIAIFVVVAAVAFALCSFQIKYVTQEVLNAQRDVQQAWVERTAEDIRAWRSKLVEQARAISSSEMFRLFAVDVKGLGPDGVARVTAPGAAESQDEAVSSLAEQLAYMQDILVDFIRSRKWIDADILTNDGEMLVAPKRSRPLDVERRDLARKAVAAETMLFGALRRMGPHIVLDMADPLHDVLAKGDPETVAVLLLTIPVEESLANFLAHGGTQPPELLPALIYPTPEGLEAARLRDDVVALSRTDIVPDIDAGIPFQRRKAIDGDGTVYSLGSRIGDNGWCLAVQTPASIVDDRIRGRRNQIYGIGALCTVGIGLLLAFLWASLASRAHKATALRFRDLYELIRRQKHILDGVNASLEVGLALIDATGTIVMCNPAMERIAGRTEGNLSGATLLDAFTGEPARTLLERMREVTRNGASGSLEVSLEGTAGNRLYRVTLFPYLDGTPVPGQLRTHAGDCVGIFQDITEYRRMAEKTRKRQTGIMEALVRSIESVDANLVGHSLKMERVVDLLATQLHLSDEDAETLRLGARLSQVGKLFVPRELLTKQGRLTPEEQREVMLAPEHAHDVLGGLQFDLPVHEVVYQMGERMDGTGNPKHLKGDEILPDARILAVVNAFCAMVSTRSYRDGMRPAEAIEHLARDPGFDADVVAALAALPEDRLREAVETDPGTPDASGTP
ncbi:MAG: PAS domain-containing protein [Desulfovibrio sp.]|jgi:PAS domain-containing protein|nr:PAS domain-containing protein [Desulfovibrio sp.]